MTDHANRPDGAQRLSLWQAAAVVARRDITAILFSRAFILFLLGPLFPVLIGALAGALGAQLADKVEDPTIAVAMNAADTRAMLAARDVLAGRLGDIVPSMRAADGGAAAAANPAAVLAQENTAALLTGTPAAPRLTATAGQVDRWQGRVALIAATALDRGPGDYPPVATATIASTGASARETRLLTAQGAQTLMFLLTMLLAGMVLSNMVEEKGNKVIEILAAAIPLDALFLGKLFAMLAVSCVGLLVWGAAAGAGLAVAAQYVPSFPAPAVGWTAFALLFVAYFAMGYLVIGALFLGIGSMAATVREVQTLSMPVTMLQLIFFFLASFSLTDPDGPMGIVAIAVPFATHYAMIARAAMEPAIWPHLAALAYQGVWVAIVIRTGAIVFRRKVMQSGPAAGGPWWRRLGIGRPASRAD